MILFQKNNSVVLWEDRLKAAELQQNDHVHFLLWDMSIHDLCPHFIIEVVSLLSCEVMWALL